MKKTLFLSAVAALVLTGCGSDETVNVTASSSSQAVSSAAVSSEAVSSAVSSEAVSSEAVSSAASSAAALSYTMPIVGETYDIAAMNIPMGAVTFNGGNDLNASWGLGSGAFARADEPNTVYTLTDRGVNINCRDAETVTGAVICPDDASATSKIFPFMDFSPAIVKFTLDQEAGTATVAEVIELKDQNGNGITGLSNLVMPDSGERGFDIDGNEITYTPNGMDTEALVKLADGTFWIGEEYAASLAHIDADGTVLKRLVPAGWEEMFEGAGYEVEAVLPEILQKRYPNRGVESIGVNPDETQLYFIMQNPLANPDKSAYTGSRNVRIFKMEIDNPANIEEYLYVMDMPQTFTADSSSKISDVKISEMLAIGDDEILILERISKTTKFYKINLTGATQVDATYDDAATEPSLENGDHNAIALTKTLVFDSAAYGGTFPTKIEGIAPLGDDKYFLVNDNDFGIYGEGIMGKIVEFDVNNPANLGGGKILLYSIDGTFIDAANVGNLPDMVKFTEDGMTVLSANEGEPDDDYVKDAEGTVSIIELNDDKSVKQVTTLGFNDVTVDSDVRIKPGATAPQDLEPEYLAINEAGTKAWVSLQENNAMAIVDITAKKITGVKSLGAIDLSQQAIDIADDEVANPVAAPANIYALYQPDTIATYSVGGQDYVVTANEGDDREYDAWEDLVKANDLEDENGTSLLSAELQAAILDTDSKKLRVFADLGADENGTYNALYMAGGRSFSIWDAEGNLVFDSGAQFEAKLAAEYAAHFNTEVDDTDDAGDIADLDADGIAYDLIGEDAYFFAPVDARSLKKGCEPEALAVASIGEKHFAYIGLEKMGGFFVYDVTDPTAPTMVEYNNDINYSAKPSEAGDLAPEGMKVFTQDDSTYLAIANELSSTLAIYALAEDGKATKMSSLSVGTFDEGAAEIVDYCPMNKQLVVTNGENKTVDLIDVSDPSAPVKTGSIDFSAHGDSLQSVSVKDGVVAIAVE